MKQMRNRKLSGHLYKRSGWWVVRYRVRVNDNGAIRTVQKAKQLCPVDSIHKTKKSVEPLMQSVLAPVNEYRREPNKILKVGHFAESVYLRYIQNQKRPSTAAGYVSVWNKHLAIRKDICEALLRDVRTHHVQSWIDEIAREDKVGEQFRHEGEPLRKETLKRIKSFLSGMFRHAINQGYATAPNPVPGAEVPASAPESDETFAYSLEDIGAMLAVLAEPARTIVATAALIGARVGEIQGMRWEHWHDGAIYIEYSVWQGQVGRGKTKRSRAPVPVHERLHKMLTFHRGRLGDPKTGWMFPCQLESGTPLRLSNVYTRQIKPVLERCAVCKIAKSKHQNSHEWMRDESLPDWLGWNAFRRGLASNLNRLGVDDSVIQAILRHSNVATTQKHYIKTANADAVAAMKLLTCADRAPKASDLKSNRVH